MNDAYRLLLQDPRTLPLSPGEREAGAARRRVKGLLVTFVALTVAGAQAAQALEVDPLVPPEINFGGRALGTIDAGTGESTLDISDSSLLFGFSKYLFNDAHYGFGVIGVTRPGGEHLEDEIAFHELHAGIGGRRYEVKLGRSRLRNTLIAFPTIREDDLLEFTHVGNASVHAGNELYQLFANQAQLSWFPARGWSVAGGVAARTETDATTGEVTSRDRLNSANLSVAYGLPEAIKFDRGLRFAGIAVDAQEIEVLDERMNGIIGSFVWNVNSNPEANWVWDAQTILNQGIDGASALDEEADRARAKSAAVVTALRYSHRPYLQTRWQAAVTLAWKDYRDIDDARSYAVVPSFLYRLGSNVDWVSQYRYLKNSDVLAAATGVDDEHRFVTGLSFGFTHTINESVGERESILTLEHDMATIGPVGGGH